ncbi:hypothetical protein EK904_010998 [Melospiza melodia maxima]|nr:hypothetical protein EK904_010998 [Melospiza melodia maxima]
MPGSPTTPGYYGVRRPFPPELDFHGTKQFGSDAYPSPLASKPFSCDPSAPQGCPALLEPYLSEQFGDHRTAPPPLPAATSSFFSAPAVPPLLPSFPSDTGHFLLREPWEQPSPESLGQPDSACSEPLQALPATSSCLSLPEPGAASPFRGSGKPKVYQGVRVKITVKELLQQRRARQAATGSAVPWDSSSSSSSSSSIQFAEPVSPPHPEPFEAEPIPPVPSCCPPWQFPSCLSCEESPGYLEQLIDSCLQSDAPSEPALSAFQPSPHYTPDTFQPVQLCFNQGLPGTNISTKTTLNPILILG